MENEIEVLVGNILWFQMRIDGSIVNQDIESPKVALCDVTQIPAALVRRDI
jgi:hypothetical protein